jgi:GNAT superfamily N-acetyltransferase
MEDHMKIVEYKHSYIDDAASLLAKRHQNERKVNKELPAKFEDIAYAKKAIESLVAKNWIGVAAIKDEQLVGYMIGTIQTDKNRERHTWIQYAGVAIAQGENEELYRELYAVFANEMVNNGSFHHYVMVPSGDANMLNAWFRSGFAYEQVHGIRDISEGIEPYRIHPDLQIRLATKEDENDIRALATVIMEHQAKSPVFAPGFIEERVDYQDGYAELIDDETVTFWLAIHQNEVVGFQVYMPAEVSDENMLIPDSCVSLVVGATVETARGIGVSSALLQNGLTHAKESGYTSCETDWRMTNLESSRFWSKNGFKPLVHRLVRHIDSRVLWAKGR